MTPTARTIASLALHRRIVGETHHHVSFDIFTEKTDDLFARTTLMGHVTGSALVIDTQTNEALVTYAAKFDKWVFSAGGHVDPGETPWQAATRELREETGIVAAPTLFNEKTPLPFLFDVHPIPASVKKNEPAHFHYDMLFLFEVNGKPHIVADPAEIARFMWRPVVDLKPPVWPADVEAHLALLQK